MTLKTFKVFDAINREGLDNTQLSGRSTCTSNL